MLCRFSCKIDVNHPFDKFGEGTDFGNGCTKLSKEVQASRAGAVMIGHKAVPHGTLEGMYVKGHVS